MRARVLGVMRASTWRGSIVHVPGSLSTALRRGTLEFCVLALMEEGEQYGVEFVKTYEEVCRHPKVDYVDVCTFPDFRLQPLQICAKSKKHVQVQKPIATNVGKT